MVSLETVLLVLVYWFVSFLLPFLWGAVRIAGSGGLIGSALADPAEQASKVGEPLSTPVPLPGQQWGVLFTP